MLLYKFQDLILGYSPGHVMELFPAERLIHDYIWSYQSFLWERRIDFDGERKTSFDGGGDFGECGDGFFVLGTCAEDYCYGVDGYEVFSFFAFLEFPYGGCGFSYCVRCKTSLWAKQVLTVIGADETYYSAFLPSRYRVIFSGPSNTLIVG